ncbi:glycosyl transferase group 1 [Desulfofarcimen acetoxidans DSM 771]|uniref:Glycosyl transferase group 1 n=1 Tax=Desulfofarcimen acetoxidans (strain ATCC 49208 / DSM 771 / KCTC 5769 / VKM B-1644 / 5575) TaxID=485916 RepID=C8W2D5_DESAS|nr:glycosyltransferase family 4 protein [Desulfofarcimen acetoxidans]ACV63619.1 glycosyl transferase group 1 [Desulfofarcimen acetoxidans DSM 771]
MLINLPPKKTLLIIHVATIGITAYKALLTQCLRQREAGLEVRFVFSPSPETELLREMDFAVKEIYIDRDIRPVKDLKSILGLSRYFRDVKPDLVHTHTSKAGVVGRIAAQLTGVPNIVHTVHGFPFHENMPFFKKLLYERIEKIAARMTDVMLFQSKEDVLTAQKLSIWPRKAAPVHIGNGVDLTQFHPEKSTTAKKNALRLSLGIRKDEPVIIMIGRVNHEKGFNDLVDALHIIRHLSWKTLVVGPDEGYLPVILDKINQYKLKERVEILGLRRDISDLLAISDIFVLPSYREGLPRSLIEAQATGLPCIASNIRGCREIIEPEQTGFLIEPGDYIALGRSLRRLLENPELSREMGRAARKRAEECYSELEVSMKILKAYRMVLNFSVI